MTPEPTVDDAFERLRPRLFGIAYRMLGSVADAEEVTQDAWLRWQESGTEVSDLDGFLVTVTTRLSIDRLRRAARRRERYVGPWLAEPLVQSLLQPSSVTSAGVPPSMTHDPAARSELADSLSFAFLVMLDELTPTERAVFLLREAFGYPHDEIASLLDLTSAGARQHLSRARRKLEGRHHFELDPDEVAIDITSRFLTAVAVGDVDAAVALVSPDVILVSDGGPDHHAARRTVVGPDRTVRLLVNIAKRLPPDAELEPAFVNGLPGMVIRIDGAAFMAMAFEISGGLVRSSWGVRNPDKLAHLDTR